jgi:hypothetical protein
MLVTGVLRNVGLFGLKRGVTVIDTSLDQVGFCNLLAGLDRLQAKSERKIPLERRGHGSEDNIKRDVKQILRTIL